ncbi:MAG: efflux RND transporter periplasmic adaptor subunit [Firmicutes bacterium]|jgi:RND family efflux transporter MFP subunit|nr:efflux RND transporter periplasmic adaptor subunit [Bacillota bacterium]
MNRKILLLGLIGILLLTACGRASEKTKESTEESYKKVVEIYFGQEGDLKRTFSMTGVFEAASIVKIIPKIQGIEEVEELQVLEGQFVKKGDILSKIDDENVRDNINSARASYQLSKDNYEKGLENYNIALDNLKRTEKLYEEGAVTKQDLENAQVMASNNELDILKGQLDIARINFENQKKSLDHVLLSSPIDGVVSRMNIEEKGYISGQSFIEIAQIDKLKLRVKLPQNVVKVLEIGDVIDIDLISEDKKVFGSVKSINYVPEDISNLYSVLIELDNPDYLIKPGMFGQVSIDIKDSKETILLPVDSVLNDSDGSYVYIVVDNKAYKTYIEIGEDNGEEIEIISGLDSSQAVVVSGQEFLEDGIEVVVVRGE